MERILLFGGTGNLGSKIAEELQRRGYTFSAVVRNASKAEMMKDVGAIPVIADITQPVCVDGLCAGFDVVISSLGKSVSLNDRSKPRFRDIDLDANARVVDDAAANGVGKFVYVSALHAEKYSHLEYFRTHFALEEKLVKSGMDYSIIRPPAIFSSFIDLIDLAKKGRLMNIGNGDKLTNPIHETDLARICVNAIHQSNAIIEAGGKEILSRKQINALIQAEANPGKKVYSMPEWALRALLPFIKLMDPNSYDKLAFYLQVMRENILASPVGDQKLCDYVREKSATVRA